MSSDMKLSAKVIEAAARGIAVRQGYDPDGKACEYGLAFKEATNGQLPCWQFFTDDAEAALLAALEAMKAEGNAKSAVCYETGGAWRTSALSVLGPHDFPVLIIRTEQT